MPSDHFVGAATAALWLAEQGDQAGALGLAYLLAVAFIVLYLGEHYVIDLAATLALAEAVRRIDPLLQTLARGVPVAARALPRLVDCQRTNTGRGAGRGLVRSAATNT